MTRIAIAIVFTVALALAAAWVPAGAQQTQTTVIQPGRAIGPIEVGMQIDRARTIMEGFGKVDTIDSGGVHGFCNPDDGVGVCVFDRVQRMGLNTPGVVVYTLTDDARFTTDTGTLKVGLQLLDFLKAYGLYTGGSGTEVRWDGRGISVDIEAGDSGLVVRYIAVFTPRGATASASANP